MHELTVWLVVVGVECPYRVDDLAAVSSRQGEGYIRIEREGHGGRLARPDVREALKFHQLLQRHLQTSSDGTQMSKWC